MKPEAGVTLDVGRHICLSHHLHPRHSDQQPLLHQQAGEQDAEGDDDRLVPGVQGDAGAVLLLRLITIPEVRMRTNPSLAGAVGATT